MSDWAVHAGWKTDRENPARLVKWNASREVYETVAHFSNTHEATLTAQLLNSYTRVQARGSDD